MLLFGDDLPLAGSFELLNWMYVNICLKAELMILIFVYITFIISLSRGLTIKTTENFLYQ